MTSASPPAPPPAARWRPLLLLTVAVALVHALLLWTAPLTLRFDEPVSVRHFTARSIVLPPAVLAPPPATPRSETPAPVPVRAAPRARAPAAAPSAAPTAAPRAPDLSPLADAAAAAADAVAPFPAASASASAPNPSAAAAAAPAATAPAIPVAALAPPPQPAPAPPPAGYAVPGSMRLSYLVQVVRRGQPMAGAADLLWLQDGQKYEAQLALKAAFFTLSRQSSTGRVTAAGLAPERYLDQRLNRSEVATHFERDKGQVTFSANAPTVPLLAGAQDRLSLFFQLGALLAAAPASYPPGTAISVQTAGPRDADTWVLTVGAEETLQLPAGEMRAVLVTRNPRRDGDQKVEVWLAPAMGWLPVRLRLTDPNGDVADQSLRASGAP